MSTVSTMVRSPSLVELLQAGAHFGHVKSKWHPKIAQYIFATRGGIHIINLEETVKKLVEACEYMKKLGSQRGLVVFVGTKRQAVGSIQEEAMRCGLPYVINRWLGGTLTNFSNIQSLVQQYLSLKTTLESDQKTRYTKKEQLMISRKIEKLEGSVGGLVKLTRKPDAIVVVDLKRERTAVAEAMKTNTPIVALIDTNINPEKVQYPIPANDDAVQSIKLIINLLADAYLEGREEAMAQTPTTPTPAATVV